MIFGISSIWKSFVPLPFFVFFAGKLSKINRTLTPGPGWPPEEESAKVPPEVGPGRRYFGTLAFGGGSVKNCSKTIVFLAFFPTSLCGVLVFDSVSRASSRPPPPPAASVTHTHTHTTHTHTTTHTHNNTHTQQHTHTHTHTHNNTHTQQHTHTTHTHNNTHTHDSTHTHTTYTTNNTHTTTHTTTQQHTHTHTWWHSHTQQHTHTNTHTHTTHTLRHSAWQAWHLATFTFVLRGRKSHLPSFCVAGVGQMALGGALGLV